MKKVIIFILIIGGIGVGYGLYQYFKPHRDIEAAAVDFEVTATGLAGEFDTNKDTANARYNEKVLLINGIVESIIEDDSLSSIVISGNENYTITCEVLTHHNDAAKSLGEGQAVELKGLYVGFFEADPDFGLPGDIKLKKSSFTKK